MRKWKKGLVLWLIGMLLLTNQPVLASEPEPTELYAKSAVLMDAASGRVLYEKNGSEVLAMASTTKIMTCILALELADIEETVEVSAYASTMPKVKLYIKKGERYKLKDLLYSLMLESHNDVAVAIAEHIGKKFLTGECANKSVAEYTTEESKAAVAAFAGLMNEKAAILGCKDSWFITPNGLDGVENFRDKAGNSFSKNHSTTAIELARIMSYCVLHSPKKEMFLEITQTISHSFASDKGRNFFCSNHNAFLSMMEGAISGKTGFTNKAGYCYVGALERDGRTYVVALLACGWPNNKSYKWSDTRKLMKHGIEDFTYHALEEAASQVSIPKKILVQDGQTDSIGQTAYVTTQIVDCELENQYFGEVEGLLLGQQEQIEVEYKVVPMLEAPVCKGDVVGTIVYKVGEECYKRKEVIITADIEKINFKWCLDKILSKYLKI